MIKMIVASTEDHLIGNKNHKLPWYIPEELKFFKEMTMDHTLLWGRKTFKHLPKKLLGRTHYVVTTAPYVEGADEVFHSEQEVAKLMKKFRSSKQTLIICGGKSIYEQFYHEASQIYWTVVNVKAHGNIYLNIDLSGYNKTVFRETKDFTVFLYEKKS